MMNIRDYLEAFAANKTKTPDLTVLDPALQPAGTEPTRLLPRASALAEATRRARETVAPKPEPPRQVRDTEWPNSYGESCWERAWANLKPHERAWSSGGGS